MSTADVLTLLKTIKDWQPFGETELAEREAMLDRQFAAMEGVALDPALQDVAEFEHMLLINALRTGQAARVLPLVRDRCGAALVDGDADLACSQDFQFMGVCVLAHLGHEDDALALMGYLVRHGYDLTFRFSVPQPPDQGWERKTRQSEWLAELSKRPEYRRLLSDGLDDHKARRAAHQMAPLSLVERSTLGGKAKKKCSLTGAKIEPGTEVVKYRPLYGMDRDAMEMASAETFADQPTGVAAEQLRTNTVPVAQMFPPRSVKRMRYRAPKLAAFHYDVAADPAALDIARAVRLIAGHDQRPFHQIWQDDTMGWTEATPKYHGDWGKGCAGDLFWKLARTGHFDQMAEVADDLEPDLADGFFALAACFKDDDVRARATAYFGIPELPEMVALALSARAKCKRAEQLADFGRAHPQWRRGLRQAMRRYAIHLYNGYVPCPNWYLDGWTQLARWHGFSLIYFCLDTPQDVPVLSEFTARRQNLARGPQTPLGDARPFFYQATLLHFLRHNHAKLREWLQPHWTDRYYRYPAEKAVRAYVTKAVG